MIRKSKFLGLFSVLTLLGADAASAQSPALINAAEKRRQDRRLWFP